jgi:hypothetical protein
MEMHVERIGEKRNAYRILVGKSEGKRPLARPRRRWVDNIKMDLTEIGWSVADWFDLAQDRDQRKFLVKAVINLRGFIKFWELLELLHNRQLLK